MTQHPRQLPSQVVGALQQREKTAEWIEWGGRQAYIHLRQEVEAKNRERREGGDGRNIQGRETKAP